MFRSAIKYLLVLPLFVQFTTAQLDTSYLINALNTESYVVSNGFERPGYFVSTSWFEGYSHDSSIVYIKPSLTDTTTLGTIQGGGGGYYINIDGDPTYGTFLVWSESPFTWNITRTSQGPYRISIPDKDFYWFYERVRPANIELQSNLTTVDGVLDWVVKTS